MHRHDIAGRHINKHHTTARVNGCTRFGQLSTDKDMVSHTIDSESGIYP
jgi:hypothetical protein